MQDVSFFGPQRFQGPRAQPGTAANGRGRWLQGLLSAPPSLSLEPLLTFRKVMSHLSMLASCFFAASHDVHGGTLLSRRPITKRCVPRSGRFRLDNNDF